MFRKRLKFRELAQAILRLKDLNSDETRKSARQWIPRLIRAFGDLPLSEISEDHWVEYVSKERARRDRKFFTDRKFMRLILRQGELRGFVPRRIELAIPDPPWDAGRELSWEEIRRLRKNASPELKFQIDIGWKMGLRLREMLRLRRDQIDLEKGIVTLGSTATKTRKGRVVPVPPDLMPRFRARLAKSAALYLFPTPKDTSRPQNNNKTAWRRCKAKAGVIARWHDLRGTCATRMLRAGVSIHVAHRYLGMGIKVLLRIYAHLHVDDLKAAAALMSDPKKKKAA